MHPFTGVQWMHLPVSARLRKATKDPANSVSLGTLGFGVGYDGRDVSTGEHAGLVSVNAGSSENVSEGVQFGGLARAGGGVPA